MEAKKKTSGDNRIPYDSKQNLIVIEDSQLTSFYDKESTKTTCTENFFIIFTEVR